MTARFFTHLALSSAAAFALYACLPAGDGVEPPDQVSYFPVGLSVDPTSRWLYVVNSDFDLQYNQGTVQSLSLERIRQVARRPCSRDADCADAPTGVAQRCDNQPGDANDQNPSFFCVDVDGEHADLPCGPFPENTPSSRAVSPGRCGPIDLIEPVDGGGSLQRDAVRISAFATDLLLVPRPTESSEPSTESRLFIPVRGDSSLHYIDTRDGEFECEQNEDKQCSTHYRVKSSPTQDPDDALDTPVEPYGIAATADGMGVVMSHQVNGRASAFRNSWTTESDGLPTPPKLVSVAENMPSAMIGIANIPTPRVIELDPSRPNYQAGFLVTFRNDASVHLLRFFADYGLDGAGGASDDDRQLLFDVARSPVTTNASGVDSRGIAIDDTKRRAAELACGDDLDCLAEASTIPFDVYVANRSPNSLLIGRTDPVDSTVGGSDLPSFHDNIPLTTGPSRVIIGRVLDAQGQWARRVFVLCFDSAVIYVYDPERRTVEAEIFTGRGPHSLAFLPPSSDLPVAFVGHFSDSYVAAVSLDQRHPETFGSTLAILGTPKPPRAAR
ncbi:MAG TPA: hypothetical protein VLC09_14430 [Polyangiaceae bacterium]|nr:hypothetical protein [Polyangiaceae bacterium]